MNLFLLKFTKLGARPQEGQEKYVVREWNYDVVIPSLNLYKCSPKECVICNGTPTKDLSTIGDVLMWRVHLFFLYVVRL